MAAFYNDLLGLQQALVYSSVGIAGLASVFLGFGMVVSGISLGLGYRIKRLALQTLGAVSVVLILHALSISVFGGQTPLAVLLGFYGLIALLISHGVLLLLFGPAVGNAVVTKLLTTFILFILGLVFASYFGLLTP